jgi:uncharacterized protein YecE (DUF72 family)
VSPAGEILVGTAGWAVPPAARRLDRLARTDSRLTRYAAQLPATEVNSSFHRHHRPATWARWAAEVPHTFRFSAKLPRTVTHDARLELPRALPELEAFLVEAGGLGDALAVLLVQLPPSLAFDPVVAGDFLAALRERWSGGVACEPRHASWFEPEAEALLVGHRVARVAADPAVVPAAAEPGGWSGLAYLRLHGSPRTYHSSYDPAALARLDARLRDLAGGEARQVWCMFDNTASGAALDNALAIRDLLAAHAHA